ncbi:MAG: carotenoid biosynthesis protein [candidate division NC10 bacterium]
MSDLLTLIIGTLTLRPYVFVFLAIYLAAASRDLGLRRALAFTGWAWAVAFLAELSSTRTGIPFGLYHYTEATRGQELFLANAPFMDSLSFTFLAYASFCLARLCLGRSRGAAVVFLSGLLMMLLDVVIDPLAVRGDRWFLGQIFYYPEGGVYFGVPLSNFLGWAVVGWVIVGGFSGFSARADAARRPAAGAALYYGVLAFNLAVTWWIGEPLLLAAGLLLHAAVLLGLWSLACGRAVATREIGARDVLTASSGGFATTRPQGAGARSGGSPSLARAFRQPGGGVGRGA